MPHLIYAKVNKETLRFIRTTKKISFDYIHRITKFSEEKVISWEDINSDKYPTINQAKALASCYRVPFAGLYMDSKDINIAHLPPVVNKRTMIGSENDDSAVNLALLDLIDDRDFYLLTKESLNEPVPSFDLMISGSNDTAKWAREIRAYFNIDINEQFKKKSSRQFFLYLRERIESKGIFVQGFKKVDVSTLRGVAIVDNKMPIIGINEDDRYPAKSFSIIHELVHVINRTSSICNDMVRSYAGDDEEVFCNAVAGELLAPRDALFSIIKKYNEFSLENLDAIAKKFSVSSEVIARRLLDTGICGRKWYEETSSALDIRFQTEKEALKTEIKMGLREGPKRNMSREAIDRTSSLLSGVLVRGYSEGLFDKTDLSVHIGIGYKHIEKYISEVMGWKY
jgi:Zn-dependent peptidase ImmA (M78 family)